MARYICTWEPVPAAWPSDIKDRRELAKQLMTEVKKGMQDGWIKDWGAYIGGNGYWIFEGSNGKEIRKKMTPYNQYFTFNVQEVLSVDDMLGMMET